MLEPRLPTNFSSAFAHIFEAMALDLVLARFDHYRELVHCADEAIQLDKALGLQEHVLDGDKSDENGLASVEGGASSAQAFLAAELKETAAKLQALQEIYERVVVEKSELHAKLSEMQRSPPSRSGSSVHPADDGSGFTFSPHHIGTNKNGFQNGSSVTLSPSTGADGGKGQETGRLAHPESLFRVLLASEAMLVAQCACMQ